MSLDELKIESTSTIAITPFEDLPVERNQKYAVIKDEKNNPIVKIPSYWKNIKFEIKYPTPKRRERMREAFVERKMVKYKGLGAKQPVTEPSTKNMVRYYVYELIVDVDLSIKGKKIGWDNKFKEFLSDTLLEIDYMFNKFVDAVTEVYGEIEAQESEEEKNLEADSETT